MDHDRLDYRSMIGINFLWNSATIGPMADFSVSCARTGSTLT
jgi:hypothetical protein